MTAKMAFTTNSASKYGINLESEITVGTPLQMLRNAQAYCVPRAYTLEQTQLFTD